MSSTLKVLFCLVSVLAVVEVLVQLRWFRPYYENGIPIFRKSLAASFASALTPEPGRLEYEFRKECKEEIAFRQLGPVSYGFRARSIDALMRGHVRFRPESASLTVTGYVPWSVPALLVYLGFAGLFAEPLFLVAVVVMLTFGYLNERQFFDKVASTAATAWRHAIEAHERRNHSSEVIDP